MTRMMTTGLPLLRFEGQYVMKEWLQRADGKMSDVQS
jgi:hypothetical protein